MGSDHVYPKRIRLVVDVSGSMYRFNGHDGRLERSLEAVLMVMEAFDKQPNFKVKLGFGDWLYSYFFLYRSVYHNSDSLDSPPSPLTPLSPPSP